METVAITIKLPAELLAALDLFAREKVLISRSEAIRLILRDALSSYIDQARKISLGEQRRSSSFSLFK